MPRPAPLLALLLAACTGEEKVPADDSAPPEHSGETGETGEPETFTPAADACEAVVAGPASDDDPTLALSRLHGAVRLFGAAATWEEADQALISALGGESWDVETALASYGPAVGGCVLAAAEGALGEATVTMEGTVAIVRPGEGALAIPAEATAIALDLRGLPAGSETAAALEGALGAVLSGEISLGEREQRRFEGYPGAAVSGGYRASTPGEDWTVSGALPAPLPLVVWTERALPPEAAAVAGALRVSGQAWLVGHPVWAGAAEAAWSPVGEQGLAWPARLYSWDDAPWPDTVPADLETERPEAHLDEILAAAAPAPLAATSPSRPLLERYHQGAESPSETMDRGAARAMLMTIHGLTDRFFPYFDVVGYAHDDALLAGLAEVDALEEGDREGCRRALGRYLHALQDGHGFFGDWVEPRAAVGYLALQIERLDGAPVVRASGYEEVLAGDTVVEIDGVLAADLYADAMAWHSAATPGYLFEVSGRDWMAPLGPVTLGLRGADGEERTAEIEAMSYEEMAALVPWGGTLRPSGWLDDLGASDLYFLNLNTEVTTAESLFDEALTEAEGAAGLVLDMRDYPAVDPYAVAAALRTEGFASPTFRVRTWEGPDEESWTESVYALDADARYTGPVAVLVSNKTVSAAETLVMMLWDDPRVTVVGQQSAGTNGNITATYLPGGTYAYFTGMHVLNPDGSELHGVGIPLDVEVVPTPDDYALGVDPELMAAIEALSETAR